MVNVVVAQPNEWHSRWSPLVANRDQFRLHTRHGRIPPDRRAREVPILTEHGPVETLLPVLELAALRFNDFPRIAQPGPPSHRPAERHEVLCGNPLLRMRPQKGEDLPAAALPARLLLRHLGQWHGSTP